MFTLAIFILCLTISIESFRRISTTLRFCRMDMQQKIYCLTDESNSEFKNIRDYAVGEAPKDKLSSNIYAAGVVQSSNVFKLVKDLEALNVAADQAVDQMEFLAGKLRNKLVEIRNNSKTKI